MIAFVIDGLAYTANSQRKEERKKGKEGKRRALFAFLPFCFLSTQSLGRLRRAYGSEAPAHHGREDASGFEAYRRHAAAAPTANSAKLTGGRPVTLRMSSLSTPNMPELNA
jgi:hypothetical protein